MKGAQWRTVIVDGDIARVILSNGLAAIIDAADAELVAPYNWCPVRCSCGFYAGTTVKRKPIRLHRLIIDAPDGVRVDHRDRNPLNCRRSNLRLATPSQNTTNAAVRGDSRTGFKGVRFRKDRGKYIARITLGKKRPVLGHFDTPEAAAAAYDAAALKHFGEFACTNATLQLTA